MPDTPVKPTLLQVKGELIVDVVAEFVSANRIQELRAFVQDKGIMARMDVETVAILKGFLRSKISPNEEATFVAAMKAESSEEPCEQA